MSLDILVELKIPSAGGIILLHDKDFKDNKTKPDICYRPKVSRDRSKQAKREPW